jgi:hypothetical protein
MNVIHTYRCADPFTMAREFSIALAAEKGVSNVMEQYGDGYKVVADDGKVVLFLRGRP